MLRHFAYLVIAGLALIACGGGDENVFGEHPDANPGASTTGSGGRAGATGSTTRGGGGGGGKAGGAGSGGTNTGGEGGADPMTDADAPDVESGTTTRDAQPDGNATTDVAIDEATDTASDAAKDTAVDVSLPTDALDVSVRDAGPSDVTLTDARVTDGKADADATASGDEPECAGPSDCPAAPSECWTKTCVDGGCGVAPVADGHPLASQTPGDCKTKVCNGNGGTRDVNNNNDVPSDSNPCTLDGCSNGSATHVPQTGMGCGVNGVCSDTGACVGCNLAADCPGTDTFCKSRTCLNHACGSSLKTPGTALPSQTPGDCATRVCGSTGDPEDVAAPGDLPANSNPCRQAKCTGTTPSTPPQDPGTSCSTNGGKVCDGAGACVECLAPNDCGDPSGTPCVVATCDGNHHCGTASAAPDTACGASASCTPGTEHLADKCNGSGTCVAGADQSCMGYVCGASACNTSCSGNPDCEDAFVCDMGDCTKGPTCADYCSVIQANCIDANKQYDSQELCLHSCAGLPRGIGAANTIECRTTHAGLASGDPAFHCPHAGPSGDGTCGGTCESFCSLAGQVCTGANQQFADNDDCLAKCALYSAPSRYTTSVATGDTFACRLYHLTLATPDASSATTHCPHIAPVSATCF